MSNENETPKQNPSNATQETSPENARYLLQREIDDDPRAAEARLDAILSEGLRPSRPHD